MPVVDSDDSRSGSSSNESDNEEVRSRNNTRSPSGSSRPQSPASGPQTPRSNRSRHRESGSRSRSTSPKSPLNVHASENGPQSPKSPSPDGIRSRAQAVATMLRSDRLVRTVLENRPEVADRVNPKGEAPADRAPEARGRPEDAVEAAATQIPVSAAWIHRQGKIRTYRDQPTPNLKIFPTVATVSDMESDQEKPAVPVEKAKKPDINISHEDLSDVSDLEDSMGGTFDEEDENPKNNKEEAQKSSETEKVLADELKSAAGDKKVKNEKAGFDQCFLNQAINRQVSEASLGTARPDENEEQLDFEAEDGECDDVKSKDGDKEEKEEGEEDGEAVPPKEEKELEEGEVSDEDDARPEETEPRPVCRFFSRGACTWGASCRFLHPGVTDKGNYTMFDMVRPMLPGEYGMGRMADERLYKPEPPLVESAWERGNYPRPIQVNRSKPTACLGLRTAKEMLKKSMRRKEQDIDFEEKKMNLSIAQEEFDKENGYYGRVPSPEPRYVRHIPEYSVPRPPPEEYYSRRPIVYEPEYAPIRREHPRPYREMPPPRGPPPEYYPPKYEEEPPPRSHERPEVRERERERRKPKREVIVQRAEKEERPARADDWQDPWMRSKSPGRRKDRKRSYSSGSSSYSSRSSSPSSKSSYRSRSRSAYRKERSGSVQRGGRHVSPSVIVSERKAANERAALMNPPAPKRRAPSPGMMRVSAAANPPAPSREDIGQARSKLAVAAALVRAKGKSKRSVKSSSGSSSGSSSESDSSESSSSSSRSNSTPVRDARKASEFVKAIDALKGGAIGKNKIKLNLKNPPGVRKAEPRDARKAEAAGKKRAPTSPPQGDVKAKKATSRREELLKQLKAVEDAIAKKRSKV
ncbi:hypothetical protein YQE_08374, partial [Dendroctonus ponderosae]